MDNKTIKSVQLNLLQWNSQSLKPKKLSLENLLVQGKIHICAISETWLRPDSSLSLSGYKIYRRDRPDSYGGVAIIVHNSITSYQITDLPQNLNPGIEIIAIKILNCSNIENIVSLYCPPSINTISDDWERILSRFHRRTILLGDFNAHHPNWSSKLDSRGSQIFDSLIDSSFVTLNDGEPTRIKWTNGELKQSSPDLSLVTSDIAFSFQWSVLNETLGSDHRIIKISTKIKSKNKYHRKRNYKKADWAAYKEFLDNTYSHLLLSEKLQDSYDEFLKYLDIAADLYIPCFKINKNPSEKFSPKSYWNQNLSRLVAERRLALAKFRRNPTPRNLEILQEKIRIAQKEIREAQRGEWHSFCSSLGYTTSSIEVYNKLNWIKGYSTKSHHVTHDKLQELLNNLAPDSVSPDVPVFSNVNSVIDVEISMQELEKTLFRCKDSSPGCDNVTYSMLRFLPESGKRLLLFLFNKFLTTGFVPKQWRDVKIVPIPKPGRDPNSLSALRPISLISCLCKSFHNILMHRLEWFIERNKVLSNKTTGFRKCRSTLDNLSSLVVSIQLGFSEKKMTVACFVDIDSAYNNVDIKSLLKTMDELGVGTKVCTYLYNFLRERFLRIEDDDRVITCRKTGSGLAQGDPLSPILFNVATLGICRKINNVSISQYADDFVLFCSCKKLAEGTRSLQLALDNLTNLLNQVGLEISPSKSKVCIFSLGNRQEEIYLKINDVPLQNVNNVKYLGVWLDRSLRWSTHIKELKEKTSKYINILKILTGPGWGVHPKHLRRLYIALIRSRIDYASFLYDNCCKTHLKKLDVLQNQCLRIIGGYLKTTPIHVMECDLNLPPLCIRRSYLAGKFWLKSKSFKDNDIGNILNNISNCQQNIRWSRKKTPLLIKSQDLFNNINFRSDQQLEMFNLNVWVNNINLTNVIRTNIANIIKTKKNNNTKINLAQVCNQYITKNYSEFYKIFTDGSKDHSAAGSAFYDPQANINIKLSIKSKLISIMSVELLAIAEALSYLQSLSAGNYVIFTDSKSALQCLNRCNLGYRSAPIAYNILQTIESLRSKNMNVVLQWIPAHIGLAGNEIVDKLAKAAIDDGINFNYQHYWSDALRLVKDHCSKMWKEYFNEQSLHKGIWFKTIQPTVGRPSWIEGADMSRYDVVTALRLRAGHLPLNNFAFLMKKILSPNCSACGTLEDVSHVLLECVRTEAERHNLFMSLSLNHQEVGVCNSILAFPLSRGAGMLYKLVKIGLKRRE